MKKEYFSILDIAIGIIVFIIMFSIVSSRAAKYEGKSYGKYYRTNFFVKVFFAFAFFLFYLLYYGGGDTTAYWDGANTLNELFFYSPSKYFDAMIKEQNNVNWSIHFNTETGFPPGWIYREAQGWFMCKLGSVFSILTFKSLPATLVLLAFFLHEATFKLFEIVVRLNLHSERVAAYATLFVPSVGFWCSGLSKDAFIFFCVVSILNILLGWMIFKEKIGLFGFLKLSFYFFLIFHIRSFVMVAVLGPILLSLSTRVIRQYESNTFLKYGLRLILYAGFFVGFVFISSSSYLQELSQEAAVVQQDFANNSTYTGKKYELNISDPSPAGMLKAFPVATFFGIYRPFLYESLSATLFLNGIEGSLLVLMTLNFLLNGNLFAKIRWLTKSEFLVFSLVFSLLIGFMAGFTSMLFGVLVRIRAPLLPFIFLIFTTSPNKQKKE